VIELAEAGVEIEKQNSLGLDQRRAKPSSSQATLWQRPHKRGQGKAEEKHAFDTVHIDTLPSLLCSRLSIDLLPALERRRIS
jgi:hypothetical protein